MDNKDRNDWEILKRITFAISTLPERATAASL